MRDTLTDLVQEQGEALLNAIANIASGNTGFEIDIPEGIDVMSDLAIALSFLAEDVADRIHAQKVLLNELELRVAKRTKELELALDSLQRSQKTYLREEWARYLNASEYETENVDWLQSNEFMPAVQKTILDKKHATAPINGNGSSALTVPINFADELIGMFGFEGDGLNNITGEELSAVEEIVEQVGLALENQRLFNQTQNALAETEALYQISADLNKAESADDIVSTIVKTLSHYKSDDIKLWTVKSAKNGSMSMKIDSLWVSDLNPNLFPAGASFDLENFPFFIDLFRNIKEVIYVASVSDDPRTSIDVNFIQIMETIDLKSMIFMPLFIGHRLVGLFTIGWINNPLFDDKDYQFFTTVASQIATAVDSLHLLDQTQQALAETQNLYKISDRLNAAESTRSVLSAIVDTMAGEHFDSARLWATETLGNGSLWLEVVESWGIDSGLEINPSKNRFECNSDLPFLSDLFKKTRQPAFIASVDDDPRTKSDRNYLELIKRSELRSFVYLPLFSGSRLIGLFVIGWKQARSFSENDTQYYTTVGTQIATSLDSLQLLDQTTQALSTTQHLYKISARLNSAETLKDIILTINEAIVDFDVYETILWQAQTKPDGSLRITMADRWPTVAYFDPENEFFSYDVADYPFLSALLEQTRQVLFVSSISDDPITNVDQNYVELMASVGINSMVYLPLVVGTRLVGLVTLGWEEKRRFNAYDTEFFTTVSRQLATAVDGLRLLEQTKQSLSETQALYQISARLNAAETAKDIVESVIETITGEAIDGARLWVAVTDSNGHPMIQNAYSWFKANEKDHLPTNIKFNIDHFPYIDELLTQSREVRLISSMDNNAKLQGDANLVAALAHSGYESMAFLPLMVGSTFAGLFTLGWNNEQFFTAFEQPYYTAMSAQIATSVERLNLLETTKQRALQLQKLTEIENALSAAVDENEILHAITKEFDSARGGLHYIDLDENNTPIDITTVAIYENNDLNKQESLNRTRSFNQFLGSELWLEQRNKVTFIPNVYESDELNLVSKKLGKDMNAAAVCFIPLFSNRRWQGVLTLFWESPHELSATENFLIDNVRDSLSAIVARHRSQVAEKEARRESEQLYGASSDLNQAASNLSEIVEVVANLAKPVGINRSILVFTRTDINNKPIGLEVTAICRHTQSENTIHVGDRLNQLTYEQISTFEESYFIGNMTGSTKLATGIKRLLEQFSSPAMGILPLIVGVKKVGFMFLLSDKPLEFGENSRRLLNSLTPQIAVAVQNSLLLGEAQTRANREQMLRQISEKVRNNSDVESVMRTAVTEIGRVLGRKTFLYLKNSDDDTSSSDIVKRSG